jgi:zinc protease
MPRCLRFICLGLLFASGVFAADSSEDQGGIAKLFQPSNSPLVTFRILFLTGAADDPSGKEGLASLTAAMMAKGGTRKQAYKEIVRRCIPWPLPSIGKWTRK